VVTRLRAVGTTLEQVAQKSKWDCVVAFFAILTPREWVAVGAVSLLSGLVGTLLFTSALAATQYISFSVVYLVQKLQPLFVIAVSSVLLREKPSRQYVMWAGVALVAGYFVTFPYGAVNLGGTVWETEPFLQNPHVWAALLALGSAAAWGSSTAISRYALLHHNTTLITGLRFLITVPLAFVAVLLFTDLSAAVNPLALSLSSIFYLLLISVSTGMFALWVYYKGLQKTPATVSAIVELAFPLTAIFVDYFLYNTVLTAPQLLAGAVLLYAAYRVACTQKV
jgi:drug/metabolite transporter (DMT)-like permease